MVEHAADESMQTAEKAGGVPPWQKNDDSDKDSGSDSDVESDSEC